MLLTQEMATELKGLLNGAHIQVVYSALGGVNRASLFVLVCLDPKETWNHGIMENSCYARFSLGYEGKLEQFIRPFRYEKKFRKCNFKTIAEAADKINAYMAEVK